MHLPTLRTLSRAGELSQSDVARAAEVSRQAVSQWLAAARGSEVAIRSTTLARLATAMGVPAGDLLRPLPGLSLDERRKWTTTLLWDHLYSDLDAFLVALADGDDRALARLVDRVGIFEAARIAGDIVWTRFHEYEHCLRKARAAELGRLWKLRERHAST